MTIDKAIEILETHPIPMVTESDHDFFDAIKLGIRALRAIRLLRTHTLGFLLDILPGETLD